MRSRRKAARPPLLTASPWPPLAAARVAGRARSRKPDVPPSSLPPVAPGARRAVSAQGSRHKCAYGALALRSAPRPSAPPPPSSPRAPARCGASSLASAWALASSGGARPVPPCPPLAAARGKACSRSPGGAPAPGWRRAFKCVRRPPGKKVGAASLRLGTSAPLCFAAGEIFGVLPGARAPGRLRALFIEQADYLQKIRRAYILSHQDKKPRKLNKI